MSIKCRNFIWKHLQASNKCWNSFTSICKRTATVGIFFRSICGSVIRVGNSLQASAFEYHVSEFHLEPSARQ